MKTNLDYFQHSTHMFQDRKIRKLVKGYEGNGYLVFTFIKTEIFRQNGYFIQYDELFPEDINSWFPFIDIEKIIEIINACIDLDLFNKEVFSKHKILTSKSIQDDFLEIMVRMKRKNKSIITEINLTNSSEDFFNYSENLEIDSENISNNSNLFRKSDPNILNFSSQVEKRSALRGTIPEFSLEKKGKEMNEISLSLEKEKIAEIFLIEKNYPEEEIEKFINHYSKTGWLDKNGHKIIDIKAAARNWTQTNIPPKYNLSPPFSEGWKRVWISYRDSLGFDQASHLLRVKPVIKSNIITFFCEESVKIICEENIETLKMSLRKVFGNQVQLIYQVQNQIVSP